MVNESVLAIQPCSREFGPGPVDGYGLFIFTKFAPDLTGPMRADDFWPRPHPGTMVVRPRYCSARQMVASPHSYSRASSAMVSPAA
jgi:hypothetical protein